jgi:DNA-binding transcriptional MerR regulator
MQQRLFTIKEVSLQTGLTTQLIRKWEERYQVVTPTRFLNGYRGYSKSNIQTLIWLKTRVANGVPIGLAVQEYETVSMAEENHELSHSTTAMAPTNELEQVKKQFLEHFLHLEYVAAQQLFDRLTALHQLEFVLLSIVQPVLVELGEMWLRQEVSEFQEHFGSQFVRDRLLAMKHLYMNPTDLPLLVTACAPAERHEIGVLFFGFFALQQGFQIVYLGTSPAEKGIFDCLHQFQPEAFAFGLSTQQVLTESEDFFQRLDAEITNRKYATKVFVGGRVFEQDTRMPNTNHTYYVSGNAKEAVLKIRKKLQ